jgi:hypothetical protein
MNNTRNEEWHLKHKLPNNPTMDQRVKWRIEHARRCPCSSYDKDILEELKKRYLGKQQNFWIFYNISDHRALGLWAAECAEKLLPYFENKYSNDARPREAIKTLRKWVDTGKFNMSVIRNASLGAHTAAKIVNKEDKAAEYAAHAAGQAVGTAHVPTHAFGTILYSIKLIATLNSTDFKMSVAKELELQTNLLPENLRPWVDLWMTKLLMLLPENIRTQLE